MCVKVYEGLVLASDSATTLVRVTPEGKVGVLSVLNVYNHANKIFNLHKGHPIGLVTWGSGAIGSVSITTLAKDFRKRLTEEYNLDSDVTIEDVASKVKRFFFDEHYQNEYHDAVGKPSIGFFVGGYSTDATAPELWQFKISDGIPQGPDLIRATDEAGINWGGNLEAVSRLVLGHGTGLGTVLGELGVPDSQVEPALAKISSALEAPLATAPMPIQDAIDLARFLVRTSIMYSRFDIGAPTVGGEIEIAAITKHEGFKWINRKHYYDPGLNPPN